MYDLPPLFTPGQRLGSYELLRRLAVGGMAEVYLAYAVGPGDFRKLVAIKRLLPQNALDPQLLRMFLDEARLMARLSHPNIPQVTDVDDGAEGAVPYFVMEYVHGTDLRGVLNAARRGRCPRARAADRGRGGRRASPRA
jgi:serine/threonine protein kinase